MFPDIQDKLSAFPGRQRTAPTYPTQKINMQQQTQNSFQKTNQRKSVPNTQKFFKTYAQGNNAQKFYKAPLSKRSNLNSQQEQRQSTGGGQDRDFDKVNQILSEQNINMRIVMDNVSRNVLVYTPQDRQKNKFLPPAQSDELREINDQIKKEQKKISRQQSRERQQYFDNNEDQNQNFDFLTGVGIQGKQNEKEDENEENVEQENQNIQKQQKIQKNGLPPKPNVIDQYGKIYEHYQNQISKAFMNKEKQQKQRKKKNPKIAIRGSSMQVQKEGVVGDDIEHLMRVYNKEHVPCKPYVMVPSFNARKDNIASSVISYLKDYKPLLSGQKQLIPKSIQSLLEVELEMLKQMEQIDNINTNLNINDGGELLEQKRQAIESVRQQSTRQKNRQTAQNGQEDLTLIPLVSQNQIIQHQQLKQSLQKQSQSQAEQLEMQKIINQQKQLEIINNDQQNYIQQEQNKINSPQISQNTSQQQQNNNGGNNKIQEQQQNQLQNIQELEQQKEQNSNVKQDQQDPAYQQTLEEYMQQQQSQQIEDPLSKEQYEKQMENLITSPHVKDGNTIKK